MLKLKTSKDIKMLVRSGEILSQTLKKLCSAAQEGISLDFLEQTAGKIIREAGALPAFLDYLPSSGRRPFPASLCLSLNEQVVHGLPSARRLKSGDLLKIDLGINYRGYFTDAAATVGIKPITAPAKRLMETTYQALLAAIQECRPGKHLGDIGWVIEKTIKKAGFSPLKELTGHGVGFSVHEDPLVLNYGAKKQGLKLKPGMVLALEPMASLGKRKVVQLADDSFATADASLTAHFEQTVAITENEPLVLTPFRFDNSSGLII